MQKPLTQTEIDTLADVIWWLKGYWCARSDQEATPADLNEDHILTLAKCREYFMHLNKLKEADGNESN